MMYFIGWLLFLIFFKLYLRFKVIGRNNIPAKGAFIFASNHTSYLDPIILGVSAHRSLNYMARDTLFKKRCSGWIMRKVHSFPVKRNKGDFSAIKEALRKLGEGKPLVIFPEGTRSKDINLKRGKPGIGFIIAKTGVPVVPAYIKGSFEAQPKGVGSLKYYPVKIYIGEPVNFDAAYLNRKGRELYQELSDEIMRRIAGLKEKAG